MYMRIHAFSTLMVQFEVCVVACAGVQIPQRGHEEAREEAEGTVVIIQARGAA